MKRLHFLLVMAIFLTAPVHDATLHPTKLSGYSIRVETMNGDLNDDRDGPFTISPGQMKKSAPISTTSLSLKNPQRGAHWYKGTGYTIKWTSAGLANAMLKLDLMKLDGTTLVQSIAENIANSGQYFWVVPLSLPDAENSYRVRIETMDNAYSDLASPFYIAQEPAPSGPPAIKVITPKGPGQFGTGLTYAIRWTSTCGKSVNGPTDDFFDIELMNSTGSTRARWLLERTRGTYDGRNSDGSHSWHWDWKVAVNEPAGTYRIRVTSLSGDCAGLGEPFQLVYRQEIKEVVLKTTGIQNCYCVLVNTAKYQELTAFNRLQAFGPYARVGFHWYWGGDGQQHIVYHSLVRFGEEYWYKDKGHVLEAKLTIKRRDKMPAIFRPTYFPVLGGVVLLDKSVPCPNNSPTTYMPPASMGTPVAVDTSQGDTWEVDLSQPYCILIQGGKPDRGVMLYPTLESNPGCGSQFCDYKNAEWYDVTLTIRFAKDIIS